MQPDTRVVFHDGLTKKRHPRVLPAHEYHEQQRASFGRLERFELFDDDQLVLPYLDRDEYRSTAPSTEELQELQAEFYEQVKSMFVHDSHFDPEAQIFVATRHGVKGDRFKISFRAVVQGYKIKYTDIPLLTQCGDRQDYFDLAPYNKNQLLGIVGGCKGNGDDRVLTPIPSQMDQLPSFTAQVLQGNEMLLEQNEQKSPAPLSLMGGQAVPGWADVEPLLHDAGFSNPVYLRTRSLSHTFTCDARGEDCPCCDNQHDR